MLRGIRGRLEKIFHFKQLGRLEAKIKRQDTLEARDFQSYINGKIAGLGQRLSLPIDEPTWGPQPLGHSGSSPSDVATSGDAALASHDQGFINGNLEQSRRMARFTGLYLLAALVGFAVMAGALYFDFQIMSEFWTRVLADEFMEVPESLVGSVVSKSAQVVFATAAFHFLLSSLSGFGRKLFIWVFFLLTFGLIAGFGLMNASLTTLPQLDSQTTSSTGPSSASDALSDLGLGPDAGSEVSAPSTEGLATQVKTWTDALQPLLWLLVPGMAFLAVTGIAALSLHVAQTNVQNYVKSLDYRGRRKLMAELEELQLFKMVIDRLVGVPAMATPADEGSNVVRLSSYKSELSGSPYGRIRHGRGPSVSQFRPGSIAPRF